MTIGGHKVEYFKDTSSPTATMLEMNILMNGAIPNAVANAKFATIDVIDFFPIICESSSQRNSFKCMTNKN